MSVGERNIISYSKLLANNMQNRHMVVISPLSLKEERSNEGYIHTSIHT